MPLLQHQRRISRIDSLLIMVISFSISFTFIPSYAEMRQLWFYFISKSSGVGLNYYSLRMRLVDSSTDVVVLFQVLGLQNNGQTFTPSLHSHRESKSSKRKACHNHAVMKTILTLLISNILETPQQRPVTDAQRQISAFVSELPFCPGTSMTSGAKTSLFELFCQNQSDALTLRFAIVQ